MPKKKKTPKKKSSDDSEDLLELIAAAATHFPVDLQDPGEIDDLATPANSEKLPDDKASE